MNKQNPLLLILLVILQLTTLVARTMATPRLDIRLDEQWKFIRQDVSDAAATNLDDAAWQSVNLPHTWNNMDGQTSRRAICRQEFVSKIRRGCDGDRGPRQWHPYRHSQGKLRGVLF